MSDSIVHDVDNTIYIAKADSVGDETVPSVNISISQKLPNLNGANWQSLYSDLYEEQARSICDALTNSLPSATRIRLINMLLKQEADRTFFRII